MSRRRPSLSSARCGADFSPVLGAGAVRGADVASGMAADSAVRGAADNPAPCLPPARPLPLPPPRRAAGAWRCGPVPLCCCCWHWRWPAQWPGPCHNCRRWTGCCATSHASRCRCSPATAWRLPSLAPSGASLCPSPRFRRCCSRRCWRWRTAVSATTAALTPKAWRVRCGRRPPAGCARARPPSPSRWRARFSCRPASAPSASSKRRCWH